jgi:FdhE protein
VALDFLGKWFRGQREDDALVQEVRGELDRLIAERPAFASPMRWLRELLPDLAPVPNPPALPDLPAARARAKLSAGIPLLRDEALAIDEREFRRRWRRAWEVRQAIQADALNPGPPDAAGLVQAVLAGRTEEVQPGLMTTLLRFTLFPFFTALTPRLAPLREGTTWEMGYCPTCGTWPLLGEFRGLDQSRFLRCGLCADSWEAPRLWCPLCGERDHERLSFLHVEGEDKARCAGCATCGGYVKMITTLTALPPLALLVADVATLPLDLAVRKN